jgi:hypothetical protein
MSENATNGRIRISWQQAATLIGFFLAIAGAWYDMRAQVAGVRSDINGMRVELAMRVQRADSDHSKFDQRLDRLEARRR